MLDRPVALTRSSKCITPGARNRVFSLFPRNYSTRSRVHMLTTSFPSRVLLSRRDHQLFATCLEVKLHPVGPLMTRSGLCRPPIETRRRLLFLSARLRGRAEPHHRP